MVLSGRHHIDTAGLNTYRLSAVSTNFRKTMEGIIPKYLRLTKNHSVLAFRLVFGHNCLAKHLHRTGTHAELLCVIYLWAGRRNRQTAPPSNKFYYRYLEARWYNMKFCTCDIRVSNSNIHSSYMLQIVVYFCNFKCKLKLLFCMRKTVNPNHTLITDPTEISYSNVLWVTFISRQQSSLANDNT